MDFSLTDEHRMIIETASRIGKEFGLEYWRERDSKHEFAADFWQAVCDAGIAGIALLVGAVGVMNTMFTSVLERTKEIGVMKAVGARNSHILTIFLIESGLMGFVGGVVGILAGLGLSGLASMFIGRFFGVQMAVVASPSLILITLAGSFSLGALAGLWPAWRASKLPVVDALRYE